MDISKFIEVVAEQFQDTDPSLITADCKFRELDEWSSLIGLYLIAMADDEFDVTLTGDDIKNAQTIEDLYNIISSKL